MRGAHLDNGAIRVRTGGETTAPVGGRCALFALIRLSEGENLKRQNAIVIEFSVENDHMNCNDGYSDTCGWCHASGSAYYPCLGGGAVRLIVVRNPYG